MNNKTYYGIDKPKALTYLEFGSIDLEKGKKTVWNFQLHQKAYDWLMLARYANDMVTYGELTKQLFSKSLKSIIDIYNHEINHPDDASSHLGKLCALATVQTFKSGKLNNLTFYELGQTLFGCIEGIHFYQMLLKLLKVNFDFIDLFKINWYGVDISELFNKLAISLHSGYQMETSETSSIFSKEMDVFFAKGVTLLYATRNAQELYQTMEKCRLSIFDYSFALGHSQDTTIVSGKTGKYISIKEFLKIIKKAGKTFYVRKNNSYYNPETKRIFVDCVLGDKNLCLNFISLDKKVRHLVAKAIMSIPEAGVLLLDTTISSDPIKPVRYNNKNCDRVEWISINNFLNSIK